MTYAVESFKRGTTRSVPSCVLVVESDVQPCQARKTVHWLLHNGEHLCAYLDGNLRCIVEILVGSQPWGHVVWVISLPRIASLEYTGVAGPIPWVLPAFHASSIHVWAEEPAARARFTNP